MFRRVYFGLWVLTLPIAVLLFIPRETDPHPVLSGAGIVLGLVLWVLSVRYDRVLARERRTKKGLCPACGYDLRATPDRCPECGAASEATISD